MFIALLWFELNNPLNSCCLLRILLLFCCLLLGLLLLNCLLLDCLLLDCLLLDVLLRSMILGYHDFLCSLCYYRFLLSNLLHHVSHTFFSLLFYGLSLYLPCNFLHLVRRTFFSFLFNGLSLYLLWDLLCLCCACCSLFLLSLLSIVCIILIISDDDYARSVGYSASDSLLLFLSEVIVCQIEEFELLLSGNKSDERVHTVISALSKPFLLISNR